MKKQLTISALMMVLTTVTLFAQPKLEWGTKFDYDVKLEEEPKVVLADNYNHYLMSIVNKHGMMAQHGIIIRKFDQKNKLVNTFKQDFPNKDTYTLYNYLGSYEIGKDKVVVFTDSYSNKTKKKEIHRIIFDKTTDTFTTTLIVGYTFESLSKSGTAYVVASENKSYFGIVYSKFSNRKIAEVDECTVIDGATFDVVWQKTVTFPLEFYSGDMTMTNSGKLVFVKRVVSKSEKHGLLVVDATSETDKDLGAEIKISKPIAISIGTQDYLIAFNFKASFREWAYSNIMLYDLELGKMINNDPINIFPGIKDIQEIRYNYVSVHDNQIDLFAECKYQTGTKPSNSFPNDPRFNEPVYAFGSGTLVVLDKAGKVLNNNKIVEGGAIPFSNALVNNFGVLYYKGDYYINTYAFTERKVEFAVFNQIAAPTFKTTTRKLQFPYYNTNGGGEDDDEIDDTRGNAYSGGSIIHQFVNYFPDSKRLLFAKYFGDGKVAFVSYTGVF
ncbi:hypothetical protein [Flavobacterium sp. 25HG05S-40]|uniref:hypothetical protein n=1 Tax=Flavobacterium sp. 25HG05S-40 TaxID=3458682 RepID=UPI004044CAB4